MKPQWSLGLRAVRDMEQHLETMRTIAVDLRCPAEVLGGARCTADATPEHVHRYRIEDFPS